MASLLLNLGGLPHNLRLQKTSERLSGRYCFISHTSPEWRLDSKNFARKWRKNIAVRMEGSGFSRLASIHEWCDFEESMTFQTRSVAKLQLENSERAGPALQISHAGCGGIQRTSYSSKYQQCDKKASQLTGFFLFMLDFLETVLHCHKFHTMQAWSQHTHEIVFLPQGHHPGS